MDFQRAFATGVTFTETSYRSEPLTRASIAPGVICRSITDPLRT